VAAAANTQHGHSCVSAAAADTGISMLVVVSYSHMCVVVWQSASVAQVSATTGTGVRSADGQIFLIDRLTAIAILVENFILV